MSNAYGKSRILIVDDTPVNIHVLMEALKDDYAIIAAKDGEKALRLAATEPMPDIVLLDVMMPGMDGYEVCCRLKENPATRDIPVIFITALTDEEDEARGLALGAVDYIFKPFRPALVRIRVHNQLELKRHRDHLGVLVEERTQELALTREATIECLATLCECRDPDTGGHIKRTQNYVKTLAAEAAKHPRFAVLLGSEIIELLYLSAPLHDVGKVGVRDEILLKPGPFSDEQFAEMRRHTAYGYQTLAKAEEKLGGNSFLCLAKDIAQSHHERWDGTGYPSGLKGDEIPLGARIMAIADVYDAIISRRVYKPPIPHEEAVEMIMKGKGGQFDPVLCDAFVNVADKFLEIALEFADFELDEKRARDSENR
jgi:putative two-component system response regulator